MIIIKQKISIDEIKKIAREMFGDFVKAVVDIGNEVIAVGGELHSDEEAFLLEKGSKQQDLWGINLYPDLQGEDWIEFDSIINLRPSVGNKSRNVDNLEIRKKIIEIVNKLIEKQNVLKEETN